MFSRSSFILLSVLTQLALALNQGDLTVSLKAVESSVKKADDIIVTAVVSNPTDKDLRVLSAHNVLDASATQTFDIKSADGKEVPFAGIKATFDLSHDSLYVTIPAGQSVAVNHTVNSFYDFSSFPAGTTFSLTAHSTSFQSGADDTPIVVNSDAVEVQVTDDLSFSPFFVPEASLSTPTCSDGGRLGVITEALRYARSLAGGAATDIKTTNPNGPRFQRYFGGNNNQDIWFNLDRVAGDQVGTRGIYCSIDHADATSYCNKNQGVIAYTVVGGAQTPIYVCELFFQAPSEPNICSTKSYDSTMSGRGGIILHELSHAVFGADDVTYGCSACAALSSGDKKRNAGQFGSLYLIDA
ncbi:hypothetical protein AAF712_007093 [Marasmius tenuissimus]|uniref:Lysine-specific metallo-endopeptidase domain-containing protein n=1 Tax=Marasmius tenuissimus TaxID=585030 RepID=A0ABR2ZXA3_9AGAR